MRRRIAISVFPLALVLAGAVYTFADDFANDRFKGTGKADPIRIENVKRADGPTAGESSIAFDLAWDHSWRAAWDVPPEQHGGKTPLTLENWDAAWVFVKFHKPGDLSWRHATLDTDASHHTVPSNVAVDLGLTDDGKRGVGAFVYRSTPGRGPNAWKGIRLRWRHDADGLTDLAGVEVKVLAIPMVYVPQCAFWVGDGSTNRVSGQFSAGADSKPIRIESEKALRLGGKQESGLGNRDAGMNATELDDFNSRFTKSLPEKFPKGYAAFYCMRTEITQQQYVDFLNTLSYAQQLERTERQAKRQGPEAPAGTLVMNSPDKPGNAHRNGIKIAVSGVPDISEPVVIKRETLTASSNLLKPGKPAVYETGAPYVACNFLSHFDGAAFAAWAGLRPMTELEFEKACRGPLLPVPDEYAWGTDGIAGAPKGGAYTLKNADLPEETVTWEGANGPDGTRGNAPSMGTNEKLDGPVRAGIFAVPDSDRVRAGASYWGILDLTGNLVESAVPVGLRTGRAFTGDHGAGGASPWEAIAFGMRGGGLSQGNHGGLWGGNEAYRVSNRFIADKAWIYVNMRHFAQGFRCVRTATTAPAAR